MPQLQRSRVCRAARDEGTHDAKESHCRVHKRGTQAAGAAASACIPVPGPTLAQPPAIASAVGRTRVSGPPYRAQH